MKINHFDSSVGLTLQAPFSAGQGPQYGDPVEDHGDLASRLPLLDRKFEIFHQVRCYETSATILRSCEFEIRRLLREQHDGAAKMSQEASLPPCYLSYWRTSTSKVPARSGFSDASHDHCFHRELALEMTRFASDQ